MEKKNGKRIRTKEVCKIVLSELAGGAELSFETLADALSEMDGVDEVRIRRALWSLLDDNAVWMSNSENGDKWHRIGRITKNTTIRLTTNEERAQFFDMKAYEERVKDIAHNVPGVAVEPTPEGIEVNACVIVNTVEDVQKAVDGFSAVINP